MNAKRVYFDFRLGGLTINPIIQASNFFMLIYLSIQNTIPVWLFLPLFVITIFATFTIIGNKFRKVQFTTDSNLLYEQQTEQAKTHLIICQALSKLNGMQKDYELDTRINYLKGIVNKTL